jgi:hypothetical protein
MQSTWPIRGENRAISKSPSGETRRTNISLFLTFATNGPKLGLVYYKRRSGVLTFDTFSEPVSIITTGIETLFGADSQVNFTRGWMPCSIFRNSGNDVSP